jgi:hypothetical protein
LGSTALAKVSCQLAKAKEPRAQEHKDIKVSDKLTETLARMWIECDPNRGPRDDPTYGPDAIMADASGELRGKSRWHWFIPRAEASLEFLDKHGVKIVSWQPIETAPRDGTAILLSLSKPLDSNDVDSYVPWDSITTVIGWWDGEDWAICFMEEGAGDSQGYSSNFYLRLQDSAPTHWMPLPDPPKRKRSG